jgi:prephenate dehydratase
MAIPTFSGQWATIRRNIYGCRYIIVGAEEHFMLLSTHWLDVDPTTETPVRAIATLGPTCTSSESAAEFLWGHRRGTQPPEVRLHDTYESAADALRAGTVSHLVVANAYSGINAFYMDPRLAFETAFVLDTPPYGLAAPPSGADIPHHVRVATHPAPALLVNELMPTTHALADLVFTTSTSVAAATVRRLETDLALTTLPAATAYQLRFISRTRTIRMLWSVFTRRHDER